MTCIVGIEEKGRVVIAGDSGGFAGWSHTSRADPKVFTRDDGMVIGYTSSYRMGQLLRFDLSFEAPRKKVRGADDMYAWMVKTFVPALRGCFKSGGFLETENGAESGGSFLVGYRGHLFTVEGDFQVGRVFDGFASTGAGFREALGALGVLRAQGGDPKAHALEALRVAERHCAAVRAPYVVAESKAKKKGNS